MEYGRLQCGDRTLLEKTDLRLALRKAWLSKRNAHSYWENWVKGKMTPGGKTGGEEILLSPSVLAVP
eukprot:10067243-Heterocapsa_arctica.AAC.1